LLAGPATVVPAHTSTFEKDSHDAHGNVLEAQYEEYRHNKLTPQPIPPFKTTLIEISGPLSVRVRVRVQLVVVVETSLRLGAGRIVERWKTSTLFGLLRFRDETD
jgi:hypothetical protein